MKFPPAETINVAKEAQRGVYSFQEFISDAARDCLASLEKADTDE